MRHKSNSNPSLGVYTRSSTRNPPPPRQNRAATPPPVPVDPSQKLHDDCIKVLDLLGSLDLELGAFILAIFYGNPASQGGTRMRDARNSLYKSSRFSEFLANIFNPPRAPSGGGTVATTGRNILIEFALKTALQVFVGELESLSGISHVTKATVSDWNQKSGDTSDSLAKEMEACCPRLWKMLATLAGDWVPDNLELSSEASDPDNDPEASLDGAKVVIKPHPHFGTILCISSLAFRSNQRNNKLQTQLAIYAHAKCTDKFVHNLLHQAGLTMSYSWAVNFVAELKELRRKQAITLAATKPILFVHDNIRMPFKVQSERGGHHSVMDNGMATSMIVLPDSARAFEDADDFGPFFR
ncbi:hypothetical protein FRC08_008567 [Ceratobasidium sp. 394]|nr:hypothetical protein FRC08_008567 [Ceratobasidium sp. 394]